MAKTTNIVITGVGGQGVIMASYVISQAALAEGYDVKQSEVHGMSQRGGSVLSHLRFGSKVWSPLVAQGTADILLSFEALEALRYVPWLKPSGTVVYNIVRINPSPVSAGLAEYPAAVDEEIKAACSNVLSLDASKIALEAGNPRAANMAMLGAISPILPFSWQTWENVIASVVPPHTVESNMKAFHIGRERAHSGAR